MAANDSPDTDGNLKTGAAWTLATKISETLLGFISTAILARLLSPTEFGLLAIATAFVAFIELVGALGLDWALVRQENITDEHLNTAWTIRASIGLFSAVVLFFAGAPLAEWYKEPALELIVQMLGLSILILNLENPAVVKFRRNLRFDKEFVLRGVPKIAAMLTSIPVAVATRSYWALLGGILAGRAVSTIMSYLMISHRPKISLKHAKELFSFSIWLFINNVTDFLRLRLTTLLVGSSLGTRAPGVFGVASELAYLPVTELAAPINRAVYSRYAQLGSSVTAVSTAFLQVVPIIWLIGLPASIGIGLVSAELVRAFLGDQWLDAIPVLRILCVAAVFSMISSNLIYALWVINKPRFVAGMTLATAVLILILLIPLARRWGLRGAAIAVAAGNVALVPPMLYWTLRFLGIPLRELLTRTWKMLVSAAIMAALHFAVPRLTNFEGVGVLVELLWHSAVGAAIYFITLYLLWRMSARPEGPESWFFGEIYTRWRRVAKIISSNFSH